MKNIYQTSLFLLSLVFWGTSSYAQTNIAPFATASASTCNTGACSTLNDLNFGTCGSQQMWISTGTPPSVTPGVEWLQFDWLSDVSFNSFTIHHAQTGTRFLAGALVQIWNGAGWTDVFTFANLPNTNCSNTVVLPGIYTTTKLRLTSFTMSGSQLSNANFREFEIWQATAVNTPKIPPLANFINRENADTLWAGSPSVLVNTSSYADSSYWNITGYNATSASGPWQPYSGPNDLIQTNTRGTWIDTVMNKVNFYYAFPQAGYYRVKLFTGNKYGTSFVEKSVFVSNPTSKPKALFFANKRLLSVYDRSQFYDLSTGGATKWKWWLDPPCYTCGLAKNEFIFNGVKNDTVPTPYIQAADAGPYKVCLAVSNAIGADTFCQASYLNIIPGFQLCNGSDSVGNTPNGAVMPTQTGSTNVQYIAGTCSQGFKIAPCADTIIISLDRLRLRNNGGNLAPGDSLYIKASLLPGGQIFRRYGGNDINNYKDSLRNFRFAGQQVYVVYTPVSPSGPNTFVNDSGFLIRWSSVAATYAKPKASFIVKDTVYSGYKVIFQNTSSGKYPNYAWDMNNDGIYGMDRLKSGIDSTIANPTVTYNVTKDSNITVCLRTFNCVGSDTMCRTFLARPTTIAPFADFVATRTYGLTTDTFQFNDMSYNGANKWRWKFEPNNLTYLGGTDSTSQNPMVFLNTNTNYTVTLTASNAFGSSISKKVNYITTISYPSPGSQFTPTSSIEDFGITRVTLIGSIGKIDTATALKPVDGSAYLGLFNLSKTTVYRGGKYNVDVYRGNNPQDSMNLRVWIDFNRNASYLDANEAIIASNSTLLVKQNGTFNVPADASIGTSRMLVGASSAFATLTPFSTTLGVYQEHGIIIGRDNVKPVITMKGNAIARTEVGKQYVDAGATATDNIEGDITPRMLTISTVDVSHVGYYTVKYVVADYYGNLSDTLVRTVQVEINQTGPVVTLKGKDTVYLEVRKDSYTDAGATAVDNQQQDITNSMIVSNNVDTATVGVYNYTYKVFDAFGFNSTKVRTVIVRDTEKPTIHTRTPNDTNFVVHQIRTPFDENAYLRVDDNYWNNIVPSRSQGSSAIDVDKAGIYYMKYIATDGSGNNSAEYPLSVKVTNTVKPVITLVGASEVTVKVFEKYTDPMAIAHDFFNNALQVEIGDDNVNFNVVGDYTRTYVAKDLESDLTSVVVRQFKVRDLDGPVITVLGENPVSVIVNSKTADEIKALIGPSSVKVIDNYDMIPVLKENSNTIPFDKPGTYVITYDAKDVYGNKAQQKSRFLQILPATGVSQIQYQNPSLHVYPNPSRGLFTLDMKQMEVKNIKIYNIAGSLVKELKADKNAGSVQIDLSGEAEGMYLVRVEATDRVYTTKVNINR